MKKLILLLMLLPFLLKAQTAFDKKYDFDNGYDAAGSLSKNFENGILIGGTTITSERNCCLVNTNCKGDTIWTKIINLSNSFEVIRSIKQAENKKYICSGEAINPAYNLSNFFYLK